MVWGHPWGAFLKCYTYICGLPCNTISSPASCSAINEGHMTFHQSPLPSLSLDQLQRTCCWQNLCASLCCCQWRSQTRAHTGLGPGVSNAKSSVDASYFDTSLYRSTAAVLSVCSGLQYSSFPDTILSGNEDCARPIILGSLVLRPWSALLHQ